MQELTLKELQQLEFEMLIDFDHVCRAHKLRYSLFYGTLLGAVRHQGYIPWDDDIDVVMPRDDYEKLLALPKEVFHKDYEVWEHRKTQGYVHPIAKLVNTKTKLIEKLNIDTIKPIGVYLDIFPADKVPSSTKQKDELYQKCLSISQRRAFSVLAFKGSRNIIRNIMKKGALAYYHHKGAMYYLKKWDAIVEECKVLESDTLKVIAFPEIVPNEICESEFNDLIELTFEDGKFLSIRDYKRLLKANYGDYMQLPKEEERVSNHDTFACWK
ncbi:MAG: LicD family protein [Longicatena sp.]